MQEQDFYNLVQANFGNSKVKPEQYSALALAYIGDAVYDMIIRTIVLNNGLGKVKNFHRQTSSIVKAEAQALLMKAIEEELSEEEMAIYKHGRNAKSSTSAKNASIQSYRIATGFESLVGFWYLNQELDRGMKIIAKGLKETNQIPKR